MKKNVFITGAAGSVGHYLIDELRKDDGYRLHLMIRDPKKAKFDLSNIELIHDDFKNIKKYSSLLKEMDACIHLLADWGTQTGNFESTIDLFENLDPSRCKKVIYFSTASILDKNNRPDPQVLSCGTEYIKGKYKLYEHLKASPLAGRTDTLFLTWVLGGDKDHPYSHAATALRQAKKWLWLIRFFSSDLRFHYIHAADIALITAYLLKNDTGSKEFTVGNIAITAGDLIRSLCLYFKIPVRFQMSLSKGTADLIARVFDKKLGEWDKYCLKAYHQEYKTVTPSDFGLKNKYPGLPEIFEEIFRDS
ncbi:MAG: NAD(P)-dependent oxidoreductase [Candidatus Saganbacteria bacterium]|nr:NAD(P)-dependent oxidoreductase [Candidatus Saganbacteria bacterium]